MIRSTLTFLKARAPLAVATAVADLDDEDVDFLTRHVDRLRAETDQPAPLRSTFQKGSGIPAQFKELLTASPERFVEISAALATRLQESMDRTPRTLPGVLAILATGVGEKATFTSVLKLDAIKEAASYQFRRGQVTLRVLRDLLPAPGELQKGISWRDSRPGSDAVVLDRTGPAARYFFSAFDLMVSATPASTESALAAEIVRLVPKDRRAEAFEFAGQLEGPAEHVVARVGERFPGFEVERTELGAGGRLGGLIRPGKVSAKKIRYRGDGIEVLVPADQMGRVSLDPAGGGWEMRIRFPTQPVEESS